MERKEFITRGNCDPTLVLGEGVAVRVFAAGSLGAENLTTCSATLEPDSLIPYHTHPTGEVITAAVGEAAAFVVGRRYRLQPYDALHVPAGVAHAVRNTTFEPIVLHTSFPTAAPEREFVEETFDVVDCEDSNGHPESLIRSSNAERYELQPNADFMDLFAAHLGSRGVCGGFGRFQPGASLPCHTHVYDESITIVEGVAICQVAGVEYELSGFDTACIPRGRPHRFINRSERTMAMIWVYAGDEPDREIIDQGFCDGALSLETLPS